MARSGRLGAERRREVGLGEVRQASIVMVGRGWAWSGRHGEAGHGAVRRGVVRQAWLD
jgi:hypothetical protein